jgi:putative transferase (TIGR04331 family)
MFGRWATENDEYNCYLYSRIIEYLGRIPFEYLDFTSQDIFPIVNNINVRKGSFLFKKIVKKFFQHMPQRYNKIVLVQAGLSINDNIRLQLSLNQIPYLGYPIRTIPKSKINYGLRNKIYLQSSDDKFNKILMHMIREQIPTLYVEGYASMNPMSLKAYPRRPKVMFNAVAFNANEPFKFWAAYNVDRNVKLLGNQHGGLYGSGLLSAPEDHQIKIYNTFYTWGWKSDSYENTKPLVAAKLNTIKREIRPKKGGRLLLVENAITRYSFIPEMLCTSSSGFLAYLNEQYRFVSALSKINQKLLLVRLYIHDYQLSQKNRWISKFPEIECSHANESIINQLNKSSLCICTYNATTYLETFVANFPTVLFWNPKHWQTRASATPYFDKLRKVGILHDTPEQAADKVNEISGDPISWWKQPDIQEAKDQFCFQFARTSDKWLEEWRCELRNQMRI